MRSLILRDGKTFGRGLIPALALTCLMALACLFCAFSIAQKASEKEAPAVLALVDEEDSVFSRMCLRMVKQQPFMQELLSFEQTDRRDARDGILEGRYAAALILPDGFTDRIRYGQEGEGELWLSDALLAGAEVVERIAALGSRLLLAAQNGVFVGQRLLQESGAASQSGFLDESNRLLLNEALSVYEKSFRTVTLPYAGTTLPLGTYFLLAWLVLLLLFSGLFFPSLIQNDLDSDVLPRMLSMGLSPHAFLLGKWLCPLLLKLGLLAAALGLAAGLGNASAEEAGTLLSMGLSTVTLTPGSIAAALLALVLLSLLPVCLAVLLPRKGAWLSLLLLLGGAGILLSGGLIPRSYLPAGLLLLGDITPYGIVFRLLSGLFGARVPLLSVFGALICCAALYLAAWYRLRIRKVREARAPRFIPFCLLVLVLPLLAQASVREISVPAPGFADLDGSAVSRQMTAFLEEDGWLRFDSREALIQAVESGRADAGLLLPEGFGSRLTAADTEELLEYVEAPASLLPALWRSQAAASLYSVKAPYLTLQALSGTGWTEDAVLEAFRSAQAEGPLFAFRLTRAEGAVLDTSAVRGESFFAGALACTLFAAVSFGIGFPLAQDTQILSARIGRKQALRTYLLPRAAFRALLLLAAAVFACLLGGTASWLPAAGLSLPAMLPVGLGAGLLAARPRGKDAVTLGIVTVLLFALALCPIFFDLAAFLPALKYLRAVLPPYWLWLFHGI